MLQAISSQLIFLKSSERSENAIISVGQTKVLKKKEKFSNFFIKFEKLQKILQIQRIKEQNEIFSFEIFQRNLFEFAVDQSLGGKIRRRHSDSDATKIQMGRFWSIFVAGHQSALKTEKK